MKDSSSFILTIALIWLSLISMGHGVTTAEAKSGQIEVVNPKTYRAPAGRYALTVDPSDRYGRGAATVSYTHLTLPTILRV